MHLIIWSDYKTNRQYHILTLIHSLSCTKINIIILQTPNTMLSEKIQTLMDSDTNTWHLRSPADLGSTSISIVLSVFICSLLTTYHFTKTVPPIYGCLVCSRSSITGHSRISSHISLTGSWQSLAYSVNKNSELTQPRGAPTLPNVIFEYTQLNICYSPFDKKEWYHSMRNEFSFHCIIFLRRICDWIQLKAELRSIKTSLAYPDGLSKCFKIKCI